MYVYAWYIFLKNDIKSERCIYLLFLIIMAGFYLKIYIISPTQTIPQVLENLVLLQCTQILS